MVCLTEGWFAGWLGRPPFTDSTSDQALPCCCVGERGCGWVEHISLLVRTVSHLCGGGGLGTLLGPEETPVRVCSWWPFLAWPA
jgi:hypothetical protein